MKRKQSWYISISPNLSQIRNFRLSTLLWANARRLQSASLKNWGNLRQNEKWTYAGDNIEIVNNFNCLGIVLSSGGSFVKAINTLVKNALKALHAQLSITKEMQVRVPVNIMFNLFDSFVGSMLNYSCEEWGFATAEKIERVHRKFIK